MQLSNKQLEGLKIAVERYRNRESYTTIAGYAGSGKAQPIDTIIPTPQGYKQLKDLQVGDYVFDRLGQPTRVQGIFPQGELEVYQVTLKDGRTTLCNDQHLFTYYTSKGNLATKSVREMIDAGLKYAGRGKFKFRIPAHHAIQYATQNYEIDPYVIGAFLGDGCCKEKLLTISSETEEIPFYVAQNLDCEFKRNSESNYNWNFYLKDDQCYYSSHGHWRTALHTQEVFADYLDTICVKAEDKSIPSIYKYGDIEQRYALIQGLMDTDGSIIYNEGRYNVRFTSTSLKLIRDVQEVLYSLGYGEISLSEDDRSDKYTVGVCYNLFVNISNDEKYKLFRLKRKYDLAKQAYGKKQHRDYSMTPIVDIQDLGYKTPMLCIKVANKEELYLTNDFIVTHNTTLVSFIIDALEVDPYRVAFVAPTGKAAQVLRSKGNPNAMTIHRLLYKYFPRKDGTFYRKMIPTYELLDTYDLFVVDEVSMCPKEMWELLLSHGIYTIACGDPAQLPAIGEATDVLNHPHVFLDEIMRQAQESEIIRLTMDIREGKEIKPFMGKEINVVRKKDFDPTMLQWADQTLCAMNRTRFLYNNMARKMRFGAVPKEPQEGERVICLKNNWDIPSTNGDALVNGLTGYISDIRYEPHSFFGKQMLCTFTPDDGSESKFVDLLVDYKLFTENKETITKENYAKFKKLKLPRPNELTFGSVITCHKSQGSEWPKVLVVQENWPWEKEEATRWLYTACTRPSEKITLVLSR